MGTTDTTQPIKKNRGRPRRTDDLDRKIYMRNYYMAHHVPKPRLPDAPKLGRPLKPDDQKLTHNMTEYQRQYRLNKILSKKL